MTEKIEFTEPELRFIACHAKAQHVALKNFTLTLVQWFFVGFFIITLLRIVFPAPYDDCDGAKERCGMKVRTDHKTGQQYLESKDGFLTPRL